MCHFRSSENHILALDTENLQCSRKSVEIYIELYVNYWKTLLVSGYDSMKHYITVVEHLVTLYCALCACSRGLSWFSL